MLFYRSGKPGGIKQGKKNIKKSVLIKCFN